MILACERAGNYRKCNVGDIGGKGKHKPQTDTNKFGCQFELKGKKLGMEMNKYNGSSLLFVVVIITRILKT